MAVSSFKTGVIEDLGQVGSIPIRLRYPLRDETQTGQAGRSLRAEPESGLLVIRLLARW